MDKEKEIQKMAKVMCRTHMMYPCSDNNYNPCSKCEDFNTSKEQCMSGFRLRVASDLYNAGYRRADEARKETAKAILQYLYGQTFEPKDPNFGNLDDLKEVIDRAEILYTAKIYGVEIEK